MSETTERGMLFKGRLVRAILEERKKQTRRPMKPQPVWLESGDGLPACWQWTAGYRGRNDRHPLYGVYGEAHDSADLAAQVIEQWPPPYGKPGDVIYVRETHAFAERRGVHPEMVWYRADGENQPGRQMGLSYVDREGRWRPSIHMPRWASRVDLPITSVRVERIQDITEKDARAEGAEMGRVMGLGRLGMESYREGFALLWEESYPGSWERNDWVWVYEWDEIKLRREG